MSPSPDPSPDSAPGSAPDSSPGSADATAPRDPAAYRPRPLLGVSFWAMIAFAVLCVLAGVAIANFGPRLLLPKPSIGPPGQAASTVETPQGGALTPAANAPAVAALPTPDVARLDARVASLEGRQAQMSRAAAAVLAAAAVAEASQSSGPFVEALASLRALTPPSAELQALARLSTAGAPSRAALAASFPQAAARAASAAQAPGEGAGLRARIVYALSRVVSLRRVGDVAGAGADAVLARAERQVEDGDLDRALHTLDALPPAAREAMADWRGRAERRTEIDRNAAALRARALRGLVGEAAVGEAGAGG
ncbi:mitofilin family membrane protein [Phenylobacterium sp.]|uniref:COG4223 family protein n=1 Tax=Phenylobacterium sp. TaxID=1871053 RepID=UPI00286BDF2A|nr:mitofilin family membrane protein [Phenylobacterium sp.]